MLLFFVVLILFAPIVQNTLNLFQINDLKGSFKPVNDINFSLPYWFNGVFQDSKEKYLNEHFGFRNLCVRLNNQLKFELFKKTSNVETVIGKKNYLFAEAYIESYTGENFIGAEKIIEKSITIKHLQQKMEEKGKIFLPVFAPNKARALNEFLPDGVTKKGMSNYEAMVMCFRKLGVKYLDFNDYFNRNYSSAKYPLFSKYGIHWSSYGHTLAADSIINYLNVHYQLNTPKLAWKENIRLSDTLRELDYDGGEGMNLLVQQMQSQKMAYPPYKYIYEENNKPSLLVVGDSYNFGLEWTNMHKKVFSNYRFLYYFKQVMPDKGNGDAFLNLNFKQEIDSHQIFLLIATEHNLRDFGWGFAEKALNVLNGRNENIVDDFTQELRSNELRIKNDKDFYSDALHEAFIKQENIDTVIRKAALRLTNEKYYIKKFRTPADSIEDQIRGDGQWMIDVRTRARKKNITVDSAITLDVLWELEHKKIH